MIDVLTLIGLGFTDALNPFSIAAMAYLLAIDRPFERGAIFIIGTLLIYLPSGFILMDGWSLVFKNIIPNVPAWITILVYFFFGLICLVSALYFYRKAKKNGKQTTLKLTSLSLRATLIFAFISTFSDLPTALPYFAGANIIAGMSEEFAHKLYLLMLYNFIYICPLILMMVIHRSAGAKSQSYLEKVRISVDWCLINLLPPIVALVGLYLLGQGIWMMEDELKY